MSSRKTRGIAGDKTLCLPIEEGLEYEDLVQKPKELGVTNCEISLDVNQGNHVISAIRGISKKWLGVGIL